MASERWKNWKIEIDHALALTVFVCCVLWMFGFWDYPSVDCRPVAGTVEGET